jgi:hypothetical protein
MPTAHVLEMSRRPADIDLDSDFAETEDKSSNSGKWSIVMEEGWFPCFGSCPDLQVHESEEEARKAFDGLKCPRILVDANGDEVSAICGAPWKKYALRMIRQKLARNHFALPCHQAQKRNTPDFSTMEDFDYWENDFFNPDAHSTDAVELPRKREPSDLASTNGDFGSSRTSDFTTNTLESDAGSSEVVPVMLPPRDDARSHSRKSSGLADEQSAGNDSIDICQSTSSSVYRLLDIDSRSGSITEEY